jgi:sulfur-carrier protein
MNVDIRIPAALRELVGGAAKVTVDVPSAEPVRVGDLLDAVALVYPALERRVRDELGAMRVHVNVFVDADNIRDLQGLSTTVRSGSRLSIVPAISGG